MKCPKSQFSRLQLSGLSELGLSALSLCKSDNVIQMTEKRLKKTIQARIIAKSHYLLTFLFLHIQQIPSVMYASLTFA